MQIVLDEMIKMHPSEELSFVQLTQKTVMLLALATAQRAQTISLIKLENIKEVNTGFEIEIPDFIKTSRPGATQPFLFIPRFDSEPRCCATRVLRRYLDVTKIFREST